MLNLNLNLNRSTLFGGAAPAPGPVCPAQTISMASIMGYYKFNDDYTNSLGEAFFGTPTPNNMNPFATGKFGSAADFNGTDSWLAYGNDNTMEPVGTGGWSLSTWVSLDNYTDNQSIWDKRVAGSTGMRILLRPGALRNILFSWNTQNASFSLPAGVFTDDTYHHVCVRQISGTNNFEVLIDDVSLGTITRSAYTASGQNLNVGRDRAASSSYLNGRLDEYSVWDRQLTDAEVTALATATCPLTSATGLLDDYTGAGGAYSLRALNSEYTGYAVRVRRGSDNAETNIGFIDGELDIATLESFCGAANGFVTTIYDQSGNGSNISQATASYQPQIVSSGTTLTKNGKPRIRFNGSGSQTATDRYYLSSSDVVALSGDLSVFATLAAATDPSTQDAVWLQLSSAQNSNDNHFAAGFRDGGHFTRLRENATTNVGNGLDTTSLDQIIYSNIWDYSETTNSLVINATTGTDLNDGRSTTSDLNPIVLGTRPDGAYSSNINFQELVFWSNNKTADRSGIVSNMNGYYSTY